MHNQAKAKTVRLNVDLDKLIYSIGYIISCAAKKNYSNLTQYDIVKSLFLADKEHLNKYGRLISDDNYYAMKHGPVPTLGYDILMSNPCVLNILEGKELPWKHNSLEKGKINFHSCNIKNFDEVLSESDTEELGQALQKIKELGFKKVRELTHEHPAYIDAWDEESQKQSFPMSLALMFEKPDYEKAEEIRDFTVLRNI